MTSQVCPLVVSPLPPPHNLPSNVAINKGETM